MGSAGFSCSQFPEQYHGNNKKASKKKVMKTRCTQGEAAERSAVGQR
jgi:hypothetical protein